MPTLRAQNTTPAKVSSAPQSQRNSSVSNPPGTTPAAPTDTSAQASPMNDKNTAPATDSAADQSPIKPVSTAVAIPIHTAMSVIVRETVDSGTAHNGQQFHAALAAPLRLSAKKTLPAGTPATLSVVSVAQAGKIGSAGEITVQIIRIGEYATLSEMVTFRGKPGPKELPDAAPAKGTEAVLPAGTQVDTTVAPIPL